MILRFAAVQAALWIVLGAVVCAGCLPWLDGDGIATTAPGAAAPAGWTATSETRASPTPIVTLEPVTPAAPTASWAEPAPTGPIPAGPIPAGPTTPLPRWIPPPGTSWQWQLTSPVDTTVDVQVYDIDGFEATPELVSELHSKGRKVICYINAGASEDFRPDISSFPPEIQGKPDGWDGEKWLDIRQLDVLRPIMAKRFDMCRDKGFDAVEADLVDGYANDTGFPLTAQHQLVYNRMLADLAHERGMSIALKNDLDQVAELLNDFDFAVNEQCVEYNECDKLIPFIQANKAVFHVEYQLDASEFCPATLAMGFSSLQKWLSLEAARRPC